MRNDFPRGDIPLLILNVLSEAARHGYAIAREVERLSEDALKLREGALYPALRVLEQDGWIAGDWEIQPTGPARKVYAMTDPGRAELARRTADWRRHASLMETLLGKAGSEEGDGDGTRKPA